MTTFFERLDSRRDQGESAFSFCKRIGLPYNSYTSWRGGGRPRAETAVHVAKQIGVDPGWLLFGDRKESAA